MAILEVNQLRVLVSTEFMFGLFVYLGTLQLSLHRTCETEAQELESFYDRNQIPFPSQITEVIGSLEGGRGANILTCSFRRAAIKLGLHSRKVCISRRELKLIKNLLSRSARFFGNGTNQRWEDRAEVRLEAARLEQMIAGRLNRKMRELGNRVDHCNSASHLQLSTFYELVDSNWLDVN